MSFVRPTSSLFVSSAADLPPPDGGGVRTLPENSVVVIEGQFTLPDGERIVVPDTSILRGRDTDFDGLLGRVNAPLIDTSGDGIVVNRLFLRNADGGSNAYCVRGTSTAGQRPTRLENLSVGGNRGILLENVVFPAVLGVLNRCDVVGLSLRGNVTNLLVEQFIMVTPGVGAVGIDIEHDPMNPTVVNAARFSESSFLFLDPTQIGIRRDVNAMINNIALFDNTFFSVGLGGTPTTGITPDGQPDVLVFTNFGVPDSKIGGNMGIPANPGLQDTVFFTTPPGPPPVVGQFVPVGNGNPNHPVFVLDPASARVAINTLPSPPPTPQAQLQTLEYIGVEPTNATIFASMSVSSPVFGGSDFSGRVVVLPVGGGAPVPLSPSFRSSTGGAINSANTIAFQVSSILQPGDRLQLQIANNSPGAAPLDVLACNVGFIGT
jgi:hypothetical protein